MPFGINNPLPSSMKAECKKAGKILASFVDPRQAFGPEKVIPAEVLANAKGLAVLTVLKAGFLGSARFGSGLVVARLADGTWSAPSAIASGGAGFGGQIGFELTDFVFILNDAAAVRTFSQQGSLTLGGNISVAAGPVGRNAEAAGAASLKGVAGVFSYSKTKGLFAGVSIEGSAIIERRDANEKLYGRRVTARQLLEGGMRPPPEADPLFSVLNSKVFAGVASTRSDTAYNDIPIYEDGDDDPYQTSSPTRSNTFGSRNVAPPPVGFGGQSQASEKPARPTGPKPSIPPKPRFGSIDQGELDENHARALFTFEATQPDDLGFKKGDVIRIVKKTENDAADWWEGELNGRRGNFPSNYVRPGTARR